MSEQQEAAKLLNEPEAEEQQQKKEEPESDTEQDEVPPQPEHEPEEVPSSLNLNIYVERPPQPLKPEKELDALPIWRPKPSDDEIEVLPDSPPKITNRNKPKLPKIKIDHASNNSLLIEDEGCCCCCCS